ncbi:unnamed protein product, partial [Effrenium voratum]
EDLDREASASPQAAPVPSPAPSPTPTPPAAVPASPTLEYRGLGRLEPVPETDSPTRKVPLVLLPSRSEQVAELVETVRSSSSSGPRVRASAAGASAGAAAAPLLELLVSRPAGAGGNSYARSDAREKQREGREVRELEEELQALRAKHQETASAARSARSTVCKRSGPSPRRTEGGAGAAGGGEFGEAKRRRGATAADPV